MQKKFYFFTVVLNIKLFIHFHRANVMVFWLLNAKLIYQKREFYKFLLGLNFHS